MLRNDRFGKSAPSSSRGGRAIPAGRAESGAEVGADDHARAAAGTAVAPAAGLLLPSHAATGPPAGRGPFRGNGSQYPVSSDDPALFLKSLRKAFRCVVTRFCGTPTGSGRKRFDRGGGQRSSANHRRIFNDLGSATREPESLDADAVALRESICTDLESDNRLGYATGVTRPRMATPAPRRRAVDAVGLGAH